MLCGKALFASHWGGKLKRLRTERALTRPACQVSNQVELLTVERLRMQMEARRGSGSRALGLSLARLRTSEGSRVPRLSGLGLLRCSSKSEAAPEGSVRGARRGATLGTDFPVPSLFADARRSLSQEKLWGEPTARHAKSTVS